MNLPAGPLLAGNALRLLALAGAGLVAACAAETAREPPPRRVAVGGAELSYVDQGSGEPVVFVHGSLADYREWLPVAASLRPAYRTVTYSRRYNYPNDNPPHDGNHSAEVEAEDLAALIRRLDLAPAHVVGFSYGGYTALLLALHEPELVRSLVLAEPAVLPWLREIPGGRAVLEDFMIRAWLPAGEAFLREDDEGALRVTVDYFIGGKNAWDTIPDEFRDMLWDNVAEWEALTTSERAFPDVDRDLVARIDAPVLMISGGKSFDIARLVDGELARVLPAAGRVFIPQGTHEMCSEYPEQCARAIRGFLEGRAMSDKRVDR